MEPKSSKSINDEAAICSILSKPLVILPEQLLIETIADPILKQVVKSLQTGWPEKKEISKELSPYFHVEVNFICGVISA